MDPQRRWRALACIDRDGTLIEDKGYLADPAGAVLLPRAARALALLEQEGVAAVLATNQSGVARGYFDESAIHAVHARMEELLAAEGARLQGIHYSTAFAEADDPRFHGDLDTRKPGPGMARRAAAQLGVEDAPLYAVGDKVADVEFGANAGGTGILVLTGEGEASAAKLPTGSAPIVPDLYDAARWILLDLAKREAGGDEALERKLFTPGQLRGIVAGHKDAGRKVVFANGCFDLLHGGHASFLEDSRAAGDCLVLGVNSNASIARLKGAGRPLLAESERLQVLAALRCVDYLTVFHTDSADEALAEILPSAHAKGTDYRADNVPELETTRALGIGTVIAGAAKENSTRDILTVIRERAAQGLLP